MTKKQICPKCGDVKITETAVDERSMFECASCSHIWYSNRGWTAGHLSIRDDITEDIENKGYSVQDYVILINISFREWEDIQQWANLNKLKVSKSGGSVRFSR